MKVMEFLVTQKAAAHQMRASEFALRSGPVGSSNSLLASTSRSPGREKNGGGRELPPE